MIRNRTEEEILQLAQDLFDGRIYTDRHIGIRRADELPFVFLPLACMSPEQMNALSEDRPGLIFEYMDKADLRWTGRPVFQSCQWLTKEDTARVIEIHEMLREIESLLLGRFERIHTC